jgi:hypothetical protein
VKIHLFYRHCCDAEGRNDKQPDWFDYEKCFLNLLDTVDENVIINVVYDAAFNRGELPESNWINKYIDRINKLFVIDVRGDYPSVHKTFEIIKNMDGIDEDDIIYICENDYIHVKGWPKKVLEIFNHSGPKGYVEDINNTNKVSTKNTLNTLDMNNVYVGLYDHPDKYFISYSDKKFEIFVTTSHHWRETDSHCNSFLLSKKLLDKDFDIQSTMSGDWDKWVWLGKNRNRKFLAPIPSLSSHGMREFLAPTIDWESINKKY